MKFIKKHKLALILVIIFLIIVIVGLKLIIEILYPNNGKTTYGDRLDGVENYEISDSVISELKGSLETNEFIESVNYRRQGKILEFEIKVTDETDLVVAKENAAKVLEYFDDNYKKFYDIQIFLISNNMEDEKDEEGNIIKSSVYPVIGYKHKNSDSLIWTVE